MSGSSKSEPAPADAAAPPAATLWQLLRDWAGVGVQSFGGGSATLLLIRRVAVERRRWITEDEFTKFWGIVQIAPGINILGLVILIGWQVAGGWGVLVSLAGLLLPSVGITVLLTAAYASIRQQPLVQAALRGVLPATVGLGLLLAYGMLKPPIAASRREGRISLALTVAIVVLSIVLVSLSRSSVLAILWGMGVLCALGHWWLARRERTP